MSGNKKQGDPEKPSCESSGYITLPCPFCGGHSIEHAIYMSSGFMECNDCGCIGPEGTPDHDVSAAEKAWNKREWYPVNS